MGLFGGKKAAAASKLYEPCDIAGWTALVTGASSGFGLATAWRFAELGCKLIIVARRGERLEALKKELVAAYPGLEVHCLVLDMMDIAKVESMVEDLPAGFKEVDILVNNAGLALGKNSADQNVTSDIVRMMGTNVTSLIVATAVFTKGMKARGRGHVINVGSIAGHEAYGGGSGYCASKHAVTAFTAAARHDLVGTPIRVTCISPGFAETEFSLVRFESKGTDGAKDAAASVYKDLVALSAADIADQIVYYEVRAETWLVGPAVAISC
mmetsp:Transcript_22133/g.69274  ORF Transcript_22133/g.69274 Transcript_22133/m.69274 type:complete len:269 (-) Transcript_22133:306-1112(-)